MLLLVGRAGWAAKQAGGWKINKQARQTDGAVWWYDTMGGQSTFVLFCLYDIFGNGDRHGDYLKKDCSNKIFLETNLTLDCRL